MNKVLVTGGGGYIGSHTLIDLMNNGYEVISVDNFINSDPSVFDNIKAITGKRVKNYNIDLCDKKATEKIFKQNPDIVAIIHFAARKAVGESVEIPLTYYQNNLVSMFNLLACVETYKIPHFIFSSSCSVYGNTEALPVTEETLRQEAESPYARTKQMGEDILKDFALTQPHANFVALRYFNPAGAHKSGLMGEAALKTALNLVPVITETAIGVRAETVVFGDDYDTRDGSCIRDYIHVMDIAHAHTLAVDYAKKRQNLDNYEIFNLGIGEGVSVLEAINAFKKVTGEDLNYRVGPRRAGDVIAIYANNQKAKDLLGWTPSRSIDDIMESAWAWEKRRRGK
jgi:UDP-glucose 4-epimerase